MADPLFHKVILQLRAKPGFSGLMNQANELSGAAKVESGVITNEQGFLNSHSFRINSTNKIRLTNLFNALWNGKENFTFECYVRLNVLNSTHTRLFTDPGNSSTSNRQYAINNAGRLYLGSSGTTVNTSQTAGTQIAINTNYHVAFVRYTISAAYPGNGIKMFINGVEVYTGASSTYMDATPTNNRITNIGGGFDQTTYDLDGYMDDIRITMYPRYLANFTPPTNDDYTEPSSPFFYFLRPEALDSIVPIYTKKDIKAEYYTPFLNTWNSDTESPVLTCGDNFEFTETYGPVSVYGSSKIDSVPEPNILLSLLSRESKRLVRQVKSDENGNYVFKNILANVPYMIIGEDDIRKPANERKNAYIKDFVKISDTAVVIIGKPQVDVNTAEHVYELEAFGLTGDTVFEFESQVNVVFSVPSITLSPVVPKKKFKVTFLQAGNYILNTVAKEGYQRFSKFVNAVDL